MMLSPRSAAAKATVRLTLRAEAQTLRWESGTIFGRDVVPEVCSTSAVSSAATAPVFSARRVADPVHDFADFADAGLEYAVRRGIGAHDGREVVAVLLCLGLQVGQIEFEFVGPIGGIQGRGGGAGGNTQECRRHFRAIVEHDRNAVVSADTMGIERGERIGRELAQGLIRERHAAR